MCSGENVILNGETFDQEGVFSQSLTSTNGCDSILFITIALTDNASSSIEESICPGTSIDINGISYTREGTFEQSLTTMQGCDSSLFITLSEFPSFDRTESFTFCGDDGILINQETFVEEGTFFQSFRDDNGCEAILTLELTSEDCSSCGSSINVNGSFIEITKEANNTYSVIIQKQGKELLNTICTDESILPVISYYGRLQHYNGKAIKDIPTELQGIKEVKSLKVLHQQSANSKEKKAANFFLSSLLKQIYRLKIGGRLSHR